MKERLLAHSVVYGGATILARATLVVMLLVLPFILTPREYGALSMISAIAALVGLVLPMEVSQGLARHYPQAPPAERPAYAGSAWWFTAGMMALFVVVAEAAARPLNMWILGDPAYLGVYRVAVLSVALSVFFYFLQNQFRWEFRTREYVVLSLVFSFLTLALSLGLGAVAQAPLLGVVSGQVMGGAAAVLLGMWRLRASLLTRPDVGKLREMLEFSIPLVPASLAVFASNYASRLILNGLESLQSVGIFTFASQIAGIGTLAVLGVQAALVPLIMAHHHEPETPGTIGRSFEIFTVLALTLCLGLGLFSPEAIHYLGNPAYAGAAPLVLLLAPAVVGMQMYIFAPGFAVAKKTTWQMAVSVTAAAAGVAANYALIALFGVTGAAIATLLTAGLFLGLWFGLSQRLYPLPISWLKLALLAAAAGAAGGVGLWIRYPNLLVALAVKAALVLAVLAVGIAGGLLPRHAILATLRALPIRPRPGPVPEP